MSVAEVAEVALFIGGSAITLTGSGALVHWAYRPAAPAPEPEPVDDPSCYLRPEDIAWFHDHGYDVDQSRLVDPDDPRIGQPVGPGYDSISFDDGSTYGVRHGRIAYRTTDPPTPEQRAQAALDAARAERRVREREAARTGRMTAPRVEIPPKPTSPSTPPPRRRRNAQEQR